MTLSLVPSLPKEDEPLDVLIARWKNKIAHLDWFANSYAMCYRAQERLEDLRAIEEEIVQTYRAVEEQSPKQVLYDLAWIHYDVLQCKERLEEQTELMNLRSAEDIFL